jgi:tetratricopeptide (TPR) repeat protein
MMCMPCRLGKVNALRDSRKSLAFESPKPKLRDLIADQRNDIAMSDEQAPITPEEHEELQEFKDLANQYAQPLLVALCAILVVAIGFNFYKSQKRKKADEAALELFKAKTSTELQAWIDRFGSGPGAEVAVMRMAGAYFADGNYQAAADTYSSFIQKNAKSDLVPAAKMGQAHCLEGLARVEEALAAFEQFMADEPGHFLYPESVLGKARCLEQLGRLDEARIVYEDFVAANPESEWKPRAEDFLKRIEREQARAAAAPMAVVSDPVESAAEAAAEEAVKTPAEEPAAVVDEPVAVEAAPEGD